MFKEIFKKLLQITLEVDNSQEELIHKANQNRKCIKTLKP